MVLAEALEKQVLGRRGGASGSVAGYRSNHVGIGDCEEFGGRGRGGAGMRWRGGDCSRGGL